MKKFKNHFSSQKDQEKCLKQFNVIIQILAALG